ncbi:hypothetical protein GDO78_016391 [Eleutherodactylus coqui]|uniref:Uncharacterized protein n=1 Tax=Eleutherodactylus coqui TaxID=57060 RepID=A0A8J6BB04_ELECQ|nr:hypothetical protein GDO78_016391 [Eleutherodactylus coqui]
MMAAIPAAGRFSSMRLCAASAISGTTTPLGCPGRSPSLGLKWPPVHNCRLLRALIPRYLPHITRNILRRLYHSSALIGCEYRLRLRHFVFPCAEITVARSYTHIY